MANPDNKKHIAIFNIMEAGHLNPGLGKTRKLVEQGHQVTCILSCVVDDKSVWKKAEDAVNQTGATYINHYDLEGVQAEEAFATLSQMPPMPQLRIMAGNVKYLTQPTIEWLKKNNVDVVVFGHYAPSAYIAAKFLSIPCICMFTQIPLIEQPSSAALHRNFQGKPGMSWMDLPPVMSSFATVKEKYGVDLRESLNPLRQLWYNDVTTLAYTLPELSNVKEENVVFVGTNPRLATEVDHPLVQKAIEWKKQSDNNKVFMVTLGTIAMGPLWGLFQEWITKEFWPAIHELAKSRPDVLIVLGLGNEARIEDFHAQGHDDLPNLAFDTYLPQIELLQHCDAALIHGGCGSTHEAVYAECPLIVVPLFGDQMDTAAACDSAGVAVVFPSEGKMVPGRPFPLAERACFTPSALEDAVAKCFTDQAMTSKVKELAMQLKMLEQEAKDVKTVLAVV